VVTGSRSYAKVCDRHVSQPVVTLNYYILFNIRNKQFNQQFKDMRKSSNAFVFRTFKCGIYIKLFSKISITARLFYTCKIFSLLTIVHPVSTYSNENLQQI